MLRAKTGYKYKSKDKNFYKSQFKKILISIIIVCIIIIIKKIDTGVTNEAIKVVNKTINYNFDFKENSKKAIEYVKNLTPFTKEDVPVFNDEGTNEHNKGYVSPVTGALYKSFGEIKKSSKVKVFNRGVDIVPDKEEVIAISDGVVIESGIDKIYGQYVRIKHGEIQSLYAGMQNVYVKNGESVITGQKVGSLRDLQNKLKKFHFEIWEDDKPVNPLDRIDF